MQYDPREGHCYQRWKMFTKTSSSTETLMGWWMNDLPTTLKHHLAIAFQANTRIMHILDNKQCKEKSKSANFWLLFVTGVAITSIWHLGTLWPGIIYKIIITVKLHSNLQTHHSHNVPQLYTVQQTKASWKVAEVEILSFSPYFSWFFKYYSFVWSQQKIKK